MYNAVTLGGVEPFNRFFFRSCYFHQSIAAYAHFGVEAKTVISNYINLYQYRTAGGALTTCERQLFDRQKFDQMSGVRQRREYDSNAGIIDTLIERLAEDSPIILITDCFDLPYRTDTYRRKHEDHYILIYGFDRETQTFLFLDLESADNFQYGSHSLRFSDMQQAFLNGCGCLQAGRDALVWFRRTHGQQKDYSDTVLTRFYESGDSLSESMQALREGINDWANRIKNGRDADWLSLRRYADNLRWNKMRHMYQALYVFPTDARQLRPLFKEILMQYMYCSALFQMRAEGDRAPEKREALRRLELIVNAEEKLHGYYRHGCRFK